MKRWLDDPDEAAAARLLSPLVDVPAMDPAARARGWRAIERRTRGPARRLARIRTGLFVLAAVAGAATATRFVSRSDPSPPAQRDASLSPSPNPNPTPNLNPSPNPSPSPNPNPSPSPNPSPNPNPSSTTVSSPSAHPERSASEGEAERARSRRAATPATHTASTPTSTPLPSVTAPPPTAAPPPPVPSPTVIDAELAAYRDARVAMRTSLSDGLARLRAFTDAYPHGRFDAEARLSIIECQVRLGRLAEAAPDVDDFLVRFPDSERAGEVRFVKAELARTVHHRCDAALADYRAATASPRVADEARFFLGFCADATGDRELRDRALTDYLAHAPAGRHAGAARALLARP